MKRMIMVLLGTLILCLGTGCLTDLSGGSSVSFEAKVAESRAALNEDFNVVIRNRDYLEKYDTDGLLKPGYIALTEHLSEPRKVRSLTRRQAEHLAFFALEHPHQFRDWKGIWQSEKIGWDLRQRARKYLRYKREVMFDVYRSVLDSYSAYADDELIEIMRSSPNQAEVSEARSILNLRR